MGFGKVNLEHALRGTENCNDLDCEIHYPGVIENEDSCLTACAHFLAGAEAALKFSLDHTINELFSERDMRLEFLGVAPEEVPNDERWERG